MSPGGVWDSIRNAFLWYYGNIRGISLVVLAINTIVFAYRGTIPDLVLSLINATTLIFLFRWFRSHR